jgi:hypothetical protein
MKHDEKQTAAKVLQDQGSGNETIDDKIVSSIAEARKQAELAYEFVPNSYTHSAMLATRAAERALADADG